MAVKAVALNFFDTLIIAGKYQHKPPFPFSPGAEFAGVVESVDSGVADIRPGDRVIGYCGWGAARESVAVRAERLVKIPDQLDFERAAGLTVTYGTTLYALRERAELRSGRVARRARRIRRNRACGSRARQDHGRARDRLRLLG